MKPARGLHAVTPCEYVQQLILRHVSSTYAYRSILNQFHRFTTQRIKDGVVSEKVIWEWLKARFRVESVEMVARRALVVDGYLDWVVRQGKLSENPLAKLKMKYGRTLTPIVQALLSSDQKSALAALHLQPNSKVRHWDSFLGPLMRDHLELMKAMGYRYTVHERYMRELDRFLQNRKDLAGQTLTVIIREWKKQDPTPEHTLHCMKIGRTLSKALARSGSSDPGIVWDSRTEREARRRHRQPYIFSESDVRRTLHAALIFPSPRSPLRPQTAYTMLILAYCAGLRLGEIVRLNLEDVDLKEGTLAIRGTKFFKTRRVPLSNSAVEALRDYLNVRRNAGAPLDPAAGLFWHWGNRGARRYSYVTTGILLMRVFRHAGIKPKKGMLGPRIHDLRHSFVVHRMLLWYRQGINPQPYLPYLATYLGHRNIHSTLVYLTITPELFQWAAEKYRQFGASALGSTAGGKP